ncbi:MAG: mce related family protein [Candidatus Xenolissoclinum pacificiensis L6]|uniref:Mce related family protein n=1 Tax=Candidatus Xenolissoclinum pacificiensis L6 TaxID=1401685 RepID=W2V2P6_9RICK|nr:MAG: mce related family protein [Candidatus Xenolissoclinum pacificiensis L6]
MVIGLLIMIGFFLFNNDIVERNKDACYNVYAVFSNVEGIEKGSKLIIAGTEIGEVVKISLDPDTFMVTVQMCIQNEIKLPEDSLFSITREGLIGERYINVTPGLTEIYHKDSKGSLQPESETLNTRDPLNLESLINKYI